MKNTLKEKLINNKSTFGTLITTSGLDTAEILANVGSDCIMIDGEHGAMDMETAGRMVSLIKPTGTVPIVRVPGMEMHLIKRGLDTGAGGIMVPMVNNKEDAEKVINYCMYPPLGSRGVGASRAVLFGSGGGDPDYYAKANEENLIIIQIEHVEAVENIDRILSVPGIDVAFIGPVDLSVSLGVPMQTDHPKVLEACEKVLKACEKHKVIAGILTRSGSIDKHLDMGFKFLLGGIDSAILYSGAKAITDEFKSLNK